MIKKPQAIPNGCHFILILPFSNHFDLERNCSNINDLSAKIYFDVCCYSVFIYVHIYTEKDLVPSQSL